MPIVESTYRASGLYKNSYFNTIYSALFRHVPKPDIERERLELTDGDFVDIDWIPSDEKDKVMLALHGLEGDTTRPYMIGMMQHFHKAGWASVGLNFRSCSGDMNRTPRTYHMGETDDVHEVILHLIKSGFSTIALVGFSLGGNVLLNYLGRQGQGILPQVKAGVAFSVPVHIVSSVEEIDHPKNFIYRARLLGNLNNKMRLKKADFPDDYPKLSPRPSTFRSFDERFTAPLNGFKNARDYWEKSSSLQHLKQICIPTLLVNARDDSFLSEECYPFDVAEQSKFFHLEKPRFGGHVGFGGRSKAGSIWSEYRAEEFIVQHLYDL